VRLLAEMEPRGCRGGEDAMVAACVCRLLCGAPKMENENGQKLFAERRRIESRP
jgi:hypothetical protein